MGYWHGYINFSEWAYYNGYKKICTHCGTEFIPNSPNQKYCSREDNPSCDDDRHFKKLWDKNKHPLQLNKEETK